MAWIATTGSTSYPIIDPQITKRLEGANTASFQCMANIPVGTLLTLKSNGTEVYIGKVRTIKRRNDSLNTVELMEEASDLKLFRLEDGGSGIVTISNPNNEEMLTSYISTILQNTGWSDGTGSSITTIPETSDPFPSLRFYNSTVAKALEKIIVLICGYKMWFDNTQKLVKYGNWNVDRSASALPTVEVRPIASDINYAIDRVIVIGKTEDISGTATVNSPRSPPRTLMYQYTECADSTEAQSIAKQILHDRSILMERFECDILPGNYIYNEGDRVRIADVRSGISGIYGVKDVTISVEKTTLGLGCSEITIFDILGDKLTEISGSSFEGTQATFSGGAQNVSSTSPAEWNIDILNKDTIENFSLKIKLDKLKTPAQLAEASSGLEIENQELQDTGVSVIHEVTGLLANTETTGIGILSEDAEGELVVQINDITSSVELVEDTSVTVLSFPISYLVERDKYMYIVATLNVLIEDKDDFNTSSVLFGASLGNSLYARAYGPGRLLVSPLDHFTLYPLSFTVVLPVMFMKGGDTISWKMFTDAINCYIRRGSSILHFIGKHTHLIQEPTSELTGIPGHDTDLIEPEGVDGEGHEHDMTDNGHTITFKTDSHSHNPPTSITTINSYPSTVSVYISNSELTNQRIGYTFNGGYKATFVKYISSYLRNGINKITITSSTPGSIILSGSFESYGV